MAKGLLDLERHFVFYGAYHSNSINFLIHIFFVLPVHFTALILFHFTPPLLHLPITLFGADGVDLNFGFVVALLYGLFYMLLDRKAGSLAALLCILCWIGSDRLAAQLGYTLAWKVVLAAQVFCWTSQFIGHKVFEKRVPALIDDLSQPLIMAAFCVLLELLQILFHYEPYPGFHAKVTAEINADRKEWQAEKQKKSS